MKALLVLTGESFRYGPQGSRARSTCQASTSRQKLASYSHLRLINYIKKQFDCNTDILIDSYELNNEYDTMLSNWYNPYVVRSRFNKVIFPSELHFVHSTNHNLSCEDLSPYDFILFIRIDFYIKKYFLTRFTTIDDSIRYAHMDYNGCGNCHNIIYLPKCYFHLINAPPHENFRYPHLGMHIIKNTFKTDLFINSFHSLSTDLNWNPLYSQVGRDESFIRENKGERYINNEWVKGLVDTEYDSFERTDTIEENVKLIDTDKFDIFSF
jgi:hypothetical protein